MKCRPSLKIRSENSNYKWNKQQQQCRQLALQSRAAKSCIFRYFSVFIIEFHETQSQNVYKNVLKSFELYFRFEHRRKAKKINATVLTNRRTSAHNFKNCMNALKLYFSDFFGFYLEVSLKHKPECFYKCLEIFWALFQASASKKSEENGFDRFDQTANFSWIHSALKLYFSHFSSF